MDGKNEIGASLREDFDGEIDMASAEQIALTVTIHENEIPPFVELALENLYENIYCTLARFKIYDSQTNVSAYVVQNGTAIKTVILYEQKGDEIKVLNQQITIRAEEIRRFARTIFSRYRAVRVISFYAVDTDYINSPYPFQKYASLEENILSFSGNAKDYCAGLSKNFRTILRRAEKRMLKEFPSFCFEIVSKTDVSEDLLRRIIEMAGARMAVKQQNAYICEDDLGDILRLIHTHGYVAVAKVDGQVCGASVWYQVSGRSFMHIIAHDPKYDKYLVGNQTLLMGICYSIGLGVRECWLMGGGAAHKSKFGAVRKFLDSIVIYRSRFALLLHWRRLAQVGAKSLMHRVRQVVLESAEGDGLEARFLMPCLTFGRSLKRLKRNWRGGSTVTENSR